MTARRHIIPIFLPQWGCPYHCVYCNQRAITSQLGTVDVVKQIEEGLNRVSPEAYPLEVAFYGGTFTALALQLQQELLLTVKPYLADGRISSIRISTHPACLSEAALNLLTISGVKTVELGVQSLDPQVLKRAGRVYDASVVVQAINELRQCGLQVGIQLMPGLPGDTKTKTLTTVRQVIDLKPDFVRVYPTVVIEDTPLAQLWHQGKYKALELAEAIEWCTEIAEAFTRAGIPIIRMGLHPSAELAEQVLAGPYHPAFKALVDSALALKKITKLLPMTGGDCLVIYCNPSEITVVRGEKNRNVAHLQQRYAFRQVKVKPDGGLPRGSYRVTVD